MTSINGNVATYRNHTSIEYAYPVVTNNSAQSIYRFECQPTDSSGYDDAGFKRTGNAEDGPILEFVCNGILDFMIGFVIHRSCFQEPCESTSWVATIEFLIPVASSRMMILAFLTSARARETRERWSL